MGLRRISTKRVSRRLYGHVNREIYCNAGMISHNLRPINESAPEMPKELRQHHRQQAVFAKKCKQGKVSFLGI